MQRIPREAMRQLFEKGLAHGCLATADCIVHGCAPPVQIGLSRKRA